jgi:hypothetical protein
MVSNPNNLESFFEKVNKVVGKGESHGKNKRRSKDKGRGSKRT